MRTALTAVASIAAIAGVAAPPAAAAPVSGATYVATAPGAERPSYLKVSSDGRRLTGYLFVARARCSDGATRSFGLNDGREKRFGLTPDGRFDHTSVGRRYTHRERGRRTIKGRGSSRLVGSFAGDQAAIRFSVSFSGPVSCTETIPLTFNRVGSPGAPASDGLMTTGRYVFSRSGSGPRIRVSTVRSLGPARVVEGLTVRWSVRRCSSGRRSYRDAIEYVPLYVDRKGDLRLSETYAYSVGKGLRARLRLTLKLSFRRRGSYVLAGTWKATARIYRRGKRVDSCNTTQRFRSVAAD